MFEHLPHFFGIGGSCGEHHVWPWLAASGGALAASLGAWRLRVWRLFGGSTPSSDEVIGE